jgi:hypothetical protein
MSGFVEVALAASAAVSAAAPAGGVEIVLSGFVEACLAISSLSRSGLRADRAMGFPLSLDRPNASPLALFRVL